jgi:hypothetical protein
LKEEQHMTEWRKKLAHKSEAKFAISWNEAVALCGPLRGSLSARANPEAAQLLDQFACWINEGGKGSEPAR